MATMVRYKELVGGTSKKQNWKGLSIAFIVIALICLFIAAAIFLTSTRQTTSHDDLIPIDENDIFNVQFPKPWNGTWISDRAFTYVDRNDSIWLYNCDTLKEELLFKRETIQQENIGHGIVSPSARYILIPRTKHHIRRFYTEYQYDLYERSKKIASISLPSGDINPLSALSYSHSDNYFAFIHNFDLYLYDISKTRSYRITTDGNRQNLHNGLVEWVYEYEIFHRNILLFWSPNDQYLAFVKINLKNLPETHFLNYDLTVNNKDHHSIPYPKYGDPLPLIDVYIYNIKSGKITRVPRPIEYENLKSDCYIFHIVWYCDKCLSIVYSNRGQNSSLIQLYEIETTNGENDRINLKSKFLEDTRKGVLVPQFLKPFFSPTGTYGFIVRFDALSGDRSSQKAYPHIVRIHFNQSHPQIENTSPVEVHVDKIVHIENNDSIIFTGSPQNNSLERHVYRWNYLDDENHLECLSCENENQTCGYADARYSLGRGSYYILECHGPSIPYATLHDRTSKLALINNNEVFREWTSNRLMPYVGYFSVPLNKKNTGHGIIIFPPHYSPNVTIASYPVIVSINDRLFDQRVTKKYILPLSEFVHVTENNISVVLFDSHGSLGQDESYLKSNHRDWLDEQYDDYIKLANHLKSNEKKFGPTLNASRFGLKARGVAAVVALKLLEKSSDGYICAFLDSPVNDLSHYHAVFSERINGIQNHLQSSRRSTIRNKSIAIAHGTANEDVHFKQSASLAKSFLSSGTKFQFKVYPDVDHDFAKDRTVHDDYFYFQRQFFHECLGGRVNKERKLIIPEEYE